MTLPKLKMEITISGVIQIALLIIGFTGVWYGLVGNVTANSTAIVEIKREIEPLGTFNTRLTVVESRAETQAQETAKVVGAVDSLVSAINQDRLTSTRNDAEIRRDVGYLREWVEAQKREARQ